MAHRLAPLLAPASVAIVGASARPGSFGNALLATLRRGGYAGRIHLVNPNYRAIDDLPCAPSLATLPEPPDLAVLGVGTVRLEAALDEAIATGARSAVIFDSCYLAQDTAPKLLDRLKGKAAAAGLPVCGGNGMGFYNFDASCHVSFQLAPERPAGHVALVAHSGSVFVLLAGNDPRHRFNLIVSPGQEIGGSLADYLDYALELPTTRAVALFMETVRDPAAFIAALEKAAVRRIPVVALKVARTPESARLAASHSAAIAGDDAAYEAVFDRYGVLRVANLDELAATAQLLAAPKRPGRGALASVTDSGGLRELMIDLAEQEAVPFASIGAATKEKLVDCLPTGLEPTNPLDAAGPLDDGFAQVFERAIAALLADEAVALLSFEFDVRDDFVYMPALLDITERAARATAKPVIVVNSFGGAQNSRTALRLLEAGVPMINGVQLALKAVRHALAFRDFGERAALAVPDGPATEAAERWRARLRSGMALDEADGLALLADFGIATTPARRATSEAQAVAAATVLGYPVALKTAGPEIHHKSEVDGVRLHLGDAAAVAAAYRDLAARLGPRVLLQKMAPRGIELAFGMVSDPQFGPLVMIGAGGTLIEILVDRSVALPPFDAGFAARLIDRLRLRPILSGARGSSAVDLTAIAESFARFSVLAATLGEVLAELDVNPVIVSPGGVVAVDALVLARSQPTSGAAREAGQ